MKRKTIILLIIAATLAVSIGMTLFLTNGFTVGRITNKVYNVQNVYDEIWNLLKREEFGKETILTKSTSTSDKVYELGVFDYICIPECNTTMTNRTGSLWILIDTGETFAEDGKLREKQVIYEYNYRTRTLMIHGTDSEDYLIEHFLTTYFSWQESGKAQEKYSLGNLGNYSIEIVDNGGHMVSRPVDQ